MSVAKQPGDAEMTDGQLEVDRTAPIGVFDSGVGGLTVARAIVDQLPYESMI